MKVLPKLSLLIVCLAFCCFAGCDDGGDDPVQEGDDASTSVDASNDSDGGSGEDANGGLTDAANLDGATADGARPDAALPDAALPDAALPDAALPDAAPGPLQDWCQVEGADFSFFVTSMNAIWALSGDNVADLNGGMGGNFGGIAGADEICQTIGRASGHGDKTWRAFLSATDDGNGNPVHAIDRIGQGPWVDSNGRLVAENLAGLAPARPNGDVQTINDLPDECGVPLSALGDAHDVVTGSNQDGTLSTDDPNYTCNDWTSNDPAVGASPGGRPRPGEPRVGVMCGHSFPRNNRSGLNWAGDHTLRGCSKGANLIQNGSGVGTCIGCSGGYGALYCFATGE